MTGFELGNFRESRQSLDLSELALLAHDLHFTSRWFHQFRLSFSFNSSLYLVLRFVKTSTVAQPTAVAL